MAPPSEIDLLPEQSTVRSFSSMTFRRLFLLVLLIWIVTFAIGLFAPRSVLSDHEPLKIYADAVSSLIDVAGSNYQRSDFPEVSKLYHSISILSLPLWICIWFKWMRGQVGRSKDGVLFKDRIGVAGRLIGLALVPLWIFLAYAFLLNHGGGTRLFQFGSSRTQLALFGMAFAAGMGGLVSLAAFSVWRAFSTNIHKGPKT